MTASNSNFPISTAAVSYFDGSGALHIRVFSSDGYTVTEQICDSAGWRAGTFNAPGSQVSATVWTVGGQASVRVYCTFEDKTVEWCSDNGSDIYVPGSYPGPG